MRANKPRRPRHFPLRLSPAGTCSPTCKAAWERAQKRRSAAAVAMVLLRSGEGVSAEQGEGVGGRCGGGPV